MRRAFVSWVLSILSLNVQAAEPGNIPRMEQRDRYDASAFAMERRYPEQPIRFEKDCPPPETVDFFQNAGWNSIEFGLSFSVGNGRGNVKPYTRYTCPGPTDMRR